MLEIWLLKISLVKVGTSTGRQSLELRYQIVRDKLLIRLADFPVSVIVQCIQNYIEKCIAPCQINGVVWRTHNGGGYIERETSSSAALFVDPTKSFSQGGVVLFYQGPRNKTTPNLDL